MLASESFPKSVEVGNESYDVLRHWNWLPQNEALRKKVDSGRQHLPSSTPTSRTGPINKSQGY
jgi:hypothetical protein